MIKKAILILLIIIPVSMLIYNDSENSPYNKDINKIKKARMYEQIKQNKDGINEADKLMEQVRTQKNYENQLIVSLFLPLVVLVLGDIIRDIKDNKRKTNFQQRKLNLLIIKTKKYFEIIEKLSKDNKINNTEYFKKVEFYFLDYYNLKDIELTEKQLLLSEIIISDLTKLINFDNYDDNIIERLRDNLYSFLDCEKK